MKLRIAVIVLLSIFNCACSNSKAIKTESADMNTNINGKLEISAPSDQSYVLKPGDEIEINIWRYDDLQRRILIGPSGEIYFPLVEEIQTAGLTLPEFQTRLAQKLSKYIVDPIVDVNITDLREQKINILGEVRTAGTVTFSYQSRLLFWEALTRAGGFTANADKKRVFLVRTEKDNVQFIVLDIHEMLETGKLDPNIYLKDGDIVYVPEKFIANIERFMVRLNNILMPLLAIERGIVLGPEVADVIDGKAESKQITISP